MKEVFNINPEKKEENMRKTSIVFGLALGLALGLGLSTALFADGGWDYSKYNSRMAMIFSGQAEKTSMLADVSSQNSRKALLAINTPAPKEIGKTTVIVAQKGAAIHTSTVAVTR